MRASIRFIYTRRRSTTTRSRHEPVAIPDQERRRPHRGAAPRQVPRAARPLVPRVRGDARGPRSSLTVPPRCALARTIAPPAPDCRRRPPRPPRGPDRPRDRSGMSIDTRGPAVGRQLRRRMPRAARRPPRLSRARLDHRRRTRRRPRRAVAGRGAPARVRGLRGQPLRGAERAAGPAALVGSRRRGDDRNRVRPLRDAPPRAGRRPRRHLQLGGGRRARARPSPSPATAGSRSSG